MIYAKRPNGKQEEFVDNKSMRTIKKIVKPIVEQEPYESRRLWKKVTAALKMQDVDAATNAKNAVEQGQRQLVKERQETNSKWINRVGIYSNIILLALIYLWRNFTLNIIIIPTIIFLFF